MNERQCIRLLRIIQTLALLPYPWEEGAKPVSDTIVLTLGQIAGLAGKALALTRGMEDC